MAKFPIRRVSSARIPPEVRIGPRKGLRVLAAEDDYGYDMIEALDTSQQQNRDCGQDGAEGHHHHGFP